MAMEPTQHYLDAPNLEGPEGTHKLAFLDWGDPHNDNVAICVHGLTRNAHDFDYLARELCSTHRVIAIDMAGRGKSGWLEHTANYNYAAYMADCIALMDNFHLRSVEWIGTSMGGIIGMMIAAFHPKRIKRLVLNDIGAFVPKIGLERIVEYAAHTRHFTSKEEAENYCREIFAPFGITEEDAWQHLFTHTLRHDEDGTIHFHYDPKILEPLRIETKNFTELHDIDLSELWEAITIPTLILRGAESDILTPETVSAMRASNVKAMAHEFEGVGHAPSLMVKDQIDVVVNWLRNKHAMALAI